MKVILLERVEGWGGLGDVVTVKDGYARNYLLPRSKALRANAANLKVFEGQRADIEARNARTKADAGKAGDGVIEYGSEIVVGEKARMVEPQRGDREHPQHRDRAEEMRDIEGQGAFDGAKARADRFAFGEPAEIGEGRRRAGNEDEDLRGIGETIIPRGHIAVDVEGDVVDENDDQGEAPKEIDPVIAHTKHFPTTRRTAKKPSRFRLWRRKRARGWRPSDSVNPASVKSRAPKPPARSGRIRRR